MPNHPPNPPESASVSSVSPNPPKRITNPTGSRVAQLARTLPFSPLVRILHRGTVPTPEEWERLKAFIADYPEFRIRRGQPEMPDANRYFICYSRSSINGERWGTKGDLADARRSVNAAGRRHKKRRMRNDPAYKAAKLLKLSALVARREAIQEGDAEEKARKLAAREKKRVARARAKRSISRKKKTLKP